MARKFQPITTDPHAWLLEPENPSVRYYTLLWLLDRPESDPEVQAARAAVLESGPALAILALQNSAGWWGNPDIATKPMYTSTAWQLVTLAELGASIDDDRIRRGVEIILRTLQTGRGDFPPQGSNFFKHAPADMLCFDGKVTWALLRLGCDFSDERIRRAACFLAETILASDLKCRFNEEKPCAWGGVKALLALAEIPAAQRTPEMALAIEKAARFFIEGDLAHAAYPIKKKGQVSHHWFAFGFPRSFQTDVLEVLFCLSRLGYAKDPRLEPAIQFLLDKRRPDGVWKCEETISGLSVPLDKKGQPSKWITLHALFVLKTAEIQGEKE